VREMKNRNSRMREIAFHTLFCMVSMVSILLTMQKKYTSGNDPLQAHDKKLMFSSINFIQTELQAIEQNKENYGYNYKLLQSLKHHLLLK
jgi:transcription termination factor NusB